MIEAFEELFDFDDDGEPDNLEKKPRHHLSITFRW